MNVFYFVTHWIGPRYANLMPQFIFCHSSIRMTVVYGTVFIYLIWTQYHNLSWSQLTLKIRAVQNALKSIPTFHRINYNSRQSPPPPPLLSPTDLFKYRLINSKLVNSTFLHNKEGCMLSDFSDENSAYMIYFVSFLGTLAVLPGNIVSALLMDKIGRLRMLGNRARRGDSVVTATMVSSDFAPYCWCMSSTHRDQQP